MLESEMNSLVLFGYIYHIAVVLWWAVKPIAVNNSSLLVQFSSKINNFELIFMITILLKFVQLMTEPFNFLWRPTGKCCVGHSCKLPHLQLSGEHKCPKCHSIVHVLCGLLSLTHDKYMCQVYYKYNTPTYTPVIQEKASCLPSTCKSD